jgi:NADH dehydrogenase FAD-containing subunit
MKRGNPQRLVLVGAGHANLGISRRASDFAAAGIEVVLVDPDAFWYSGLATAMLGGQHSPDEDRIPPGEVIGPRGGRFVRDRLVAIDRRSRELTLGSGRTLRYDALSLNLGSEVSLDHVPGGGRWGVPVKPTSNLWRLRRELEQRFAAGAAPRVVVAGGGASGCEVAANVDALARKHGASAELLVISRSPRLLREAPPRASRRILRSFERRGIAVSSACSVDACRPGQVDCSDGMRPFYDLVVMATGLKAPPVAAELGLATGPGGGLLVRETLQSVSDTRIFAGGDCAELSGRPLPRLGVFAVRQTPVLAANLRAALLGGRFASYRPQRRWLSILNLGPGEGLALWGGLSWHGRLAARLKHRIDLRFLERFRAR